MVSRISRRTRRGPRRWSSVPAAALALAVAAAGALVAGSPDAAVAGSATSQYGTLSAPDGVLPAANQCGTFGYSYDLTPPKGTWAAEFFVTDPLGHTVTSYAALDSYSAGGTRGSTTYTLCSNYTRAGVFTINAKLSTDDGTGKVTNYQLTPATFTLSAPAVGGAAPQHTQQRKTSAQKKAAQKKKAQKKKARAKRLRDRRDDRRP